MTPYKFTMLYSTRENYPSFRVDLTELFSAGLALKGHHIDWHMQSAQPSKSRNLRLNETEQVFLGPTVAGKRPWHKILRLVAALCHDTALLRLSGDKDYDFIQVRDKMFGGLVGAIAARVRHIPFFYWMSFPYPEADIYRAADRQMDFSSATRWFYRVRGILTGWLLYKVVLPRADHVFVQSDRMSQDVAARGIRPDCMSAVPMGINMDAVDRGSAEERSLPWRAGTLPLIYVGTLVRIRRIDFLIDMLKRVRGKEPRAVLVLVGDAPEQDVQFLRDEARRFGVDEHVIFTGFVRMERAWGYIRQAKVCLSPFRPSPILDSTSPTKVVEYLAWGRPVVANAHPDQSKVLGESGAGFAVAYDPQAFADAVVELLRNPAKAEEMGRRGVEYVRRHRSYAALSWQLEQKYIELLGKAGRRHSARCAT